MISARPRALVILLVAALALTALATAFLNREPEGPALRPAAQRPVLLLLTSLPLVFGEDFSLRDVGSPALKALEGRYRVMPISVAEPKELAKGKLLMMAHPLAQPAEDLVALDEWVRAGGRVMLLADPMLEWPSERPLGDSLRPPPMFMDTGLLAHWGLRLDAPDRRGPKMETLAGFEVATVSPGELAGQCRIGADALVAHCSIGKGRATVIADADLLDLPNLGNAGRQNMDAILTELGRLEQ
jgi:hypothetical protein